MRDVARKQPRHPGLAKPVGEGRQEGHPAAHPAQGSAVSCSGPQGHMHQPSPRVRATDDDWVFHYLFGKGVFLYNLQEKSIQVH